MQHDIQEIQKFDALAEDWWNPNGKLGPLHQLNPTRLGYIQAQYPTLSTARLLDVGCGGGILSEGLARAGARVTAIDLSAAAIQVAKAHATEQALAIDYHHTSIETFSETEPEPYDVITCMELLEHVPNPAQFIQYCVKLLKPNGYIFFATINRNLKSFLGAIVASEYLLGLLEKGTHRYETFIRPSELDSWAHSAGLDFQHIQGVRFHPLGKRFELCQDVDINYMATYRKQDSTL